jgi:uncharacterized protein (DUF1501 family)
MTDRSDACCGEYAALTRRGLLRGAALAGATTAFGSAVVTAAAASPTEAEAVLVVLSLRGAADGLSLVVPHADPVYYQARPEIAVPAERLLARDAAFGLHPELAPLLPLWQAGRLAAVHGTGLPAPNRSHFAAMEELEDADPGSATRRGWLNRLIGTDAQRSPLQGFNLGGGVLPTSLYGDDPVLSGTNVADVGIAGDDQWDPHDWRRRSLHTLWDRNTGPMGRAMRSMFAAVDGFAPVKETTDNRGRYPEGDLGAAMASAARVVRGNVGVAVITVDHGDWDMHSDLGTLAWGSMRRNAAEFASAVAAFFGDLGDQAGKVTLVALSEFGRRVVQNANYGLDHGYGNVMFVAGAGVKGGRYYGTLPPLTGDVDSDVPVTTDYRSVLSEIVTTRFGASSAAVFPGFQPESVGVMTSL